MPRRAASPGHPDAFRRPANLVGRIDFVTLKLFLAIVEEQSIAKAAEREAIAASAVSKRIADLEAALGVRLLDRRRKGIQPTEAGEAVLHYARSILRDLARLEGELGDYAAGARGIVRIAAAETALVTFVPRVLESFSVRYPTIRVDLRTMVSPRIVKAVLEGEADLGVFWGSAPTEGLQVLPCFTDHLMVVVPSGHPIARLRSVRFHEILDYEFIQQETNSSVQAILERSASAIGQPLRTRIRVNSYDAALSMSQAGFGLAIVPDTYATKFATTTRMAIIRLDEPWATRQYDLCARVPSELSSQTRALLAHFVETAKP